MSAPKPRSRITRRVAVTLAAMSVVTAVAASGTATAVSGSPEVEPRTAASASTAPNLHVDAANGVTYQYRRFGHPSTTRRTCQGRRSATSWATSPPMEKPNRS